MCKPPRRFHVQRTRRDGFEELYCPDYGFQLRLLLWLWLITLRGMLDELVLLVRLAELSAELMRRECFSCSMMSVSCMYLRIFVTACPCTCPCICISSASSSSTAPARQRKGKAVSACASTRPLTRTTHRRPRTTHADRTQYDARGV